MNFNPRSPYGERHRLDAITPRPDPFQSTLPLRGATIYKIIGYTATRISIHAPLTGSDGLETWERFGSYIFQSTLPLRGATGAVECFDDYCANFNPRSPYGERQPASFKMSRNFYFNPRSPYGERRPNRPPPCAVRRFQSTLPLRGATCCLRRKETACIISIHAPLTGSDLIYVCTYYEFRYFNPRSPYGERLTKAPTGGVEIDFNPRSPYGERLKMSLLPPLK